MRPHKVSGKLRRLERIKVLNWVSLVPRKYGIISIYVYILLIESKIGRNIRFNIELHPTQTKN